MGHVFLRGLVHQKLSGRSPPVHDSATRFHRHRRAADPSPFFKRFDDPLVLGRMARAGAHVGEAQLLQKLSDVALVEIDAEPGGDGVLEVGPSPAHDAVLFAIRPGLDDCGELGCSS